MKYFAWLAVQNKDSVHNENLRLLPTILEHRYVFYVPNTNIQYRE